MRVLHVIQELRPGGAERVLISLAGGSERQGHAVATAAAPGPLVAELSGRTYSLPVLSRRPWLVPGAALALRSALRDFHPDLVHAHNPGMAAVTALATLRGRRAPAVVSFHGVPDDEYAAAARVLRIAGLPVVACGPGVAEALAARACSVRATILNGISPAPAAADRRALQRELGLDEELSLIVGVGRLVPQKNFALAVRGVAEMDGAALVVVGEGNLRTELEALTAKLGIAHRVVFAGFRPDARKIVGAADAVVVSSEWEGLSLAVLEALASGTPLVATAVRGIRELVEHERHALLVPPNDAVALRLALERVLADRALAASLGASARELAARHGEDRMVRGYLDLYDELLRA